MLKLKKIPPFLRNLGIAVVLGMVGVSCTTAVETGREALDASKEIMGARVEQRLAWQEADANLCSEYVKALVDAAKAKVAQGDMEGAKAAFEDARAASLECRPVLSNATERVVGRIGERLDETEVEE